MRITNERLTEGKIHYNNWSQNYRLTLLLKRAKQIQEDLEKDKRISTNACVLCYYHPDGIIAMQAFHYANCACCDTEISSGSSHIDMICQPCAKEKDLCAECGANMDYGVKPEVAIKKATRKSRKK